MRLRMLKLGVGKGRQVMKQLCLRALQLQWLERAGYVLYRALVALVLLLVTNDNLATVNFTPWIFLAYRFSLPSLCASYGEDAPSYSYSGNQQ